MKIYIICIILEILYTHTLAKIADIFLLHIQKTIVFFLSSIKFKIERRKNINERENGINRCLRMYWSRWRRTRFLSLLALFWNLYSEQRRRCSFSLSLPFYAIKVQVSTFDWHVRCVCMQTQRKSVLILFFFLPFHLLLWKWNSIQCQRFFPIILVETIKIWSKASSLHSNAVKLSLLMRTNSKHACANITNECSHTRTHAHTWWSSAKDN